MKLIALLLDDFPQFAHFFAEIGAQVFHIADNDSAAFAVALVIELGQNAAEVVAVYELADRVGQGVFNLLVVFSGVAGDDFVENDRGRRHGEGEGDAFAVALTILEREVMEEDGNGGGVLRMGIFGQVPDRFDLDADLS